MPDSGILSAPIFAIAKRINCTIERFRVLCFVLCAEMAKRGRMVDSSASIKRWSFMTAWESKRFLFILTTPNVMNTEHTSPHVYLGVFERMDSGRWSSHHWRIATKWMLQAQNNTNKSMELFCVLYARNANLNQFVAACRVDNDKYQFRLTTAEYSSKTRCKLFLQFIYK